MKSELTDRFRDHGAVAERVLRPTPMQVAMVFASLREPEAGNYVQQLRIRLHEPSRSEDWRKAFELVLERHAGLRASFDLTAENGPEIRIAPAAGLPFREEDLSGLNPWDQERALRDFLKADQRAGFAVDQAPLMRLAWFTLGPAEHELIWTSHHALFDGRGRYLVLREITEIHEALVSGRSPELTTPVSCESFLDWMANRDSQPDETFWSSKLAGMEEPLPLGFPVAGKESIGSDDRRALRARLGHGFGEQLEAFARSAGVTVNTLVQAAWSIVLWRQTGREEVVFGAPRACRHGSVPDAGEMVAVMVNTVPVRVRMETGMAATDLLKVLRDLWVAMRPHEHAPVTLMRKAAGLAPNQPLFESLVGFEGYELTDRLRHDDPRWINREATLEARTELPLTLQVYRSAEWELVLTYDPGRFQGQGAEWLAERFTTALRGLVEGTGSTLGEIPVVGPSERRQLLTWGVREGPYPRDETVHGRFAEVARLHSDREAVVSGETIWTYADLDERSNGLAVILHDQAGVEGKLVAVIGPRCPEQILAMVAILKAGAAYLPLDPEFPDERLRLLIEESGAVCLVSCGGWSETGRDLDVPAFAATVAIRRLPTGPSTAAGPDSAAYVMFTSGSTGRPKGVEVPHRGIMRLLFGIDYVDLGPERSLIHLSPAAFDASTFEIWGSLLHGGRCILYPERVPTPDQLGGVIRKYKVDTLWITCSLFNFMLDEAPEVLAPIRRLLTGGEILSRDHVERAVRKLPDTRLINCYGPTEATTFTTTFDIPRDYRASDGPVPIGGPISNTSVIVVDAHDRLVPIGSEGELLIGGPGVALGYRRRPDLTTARFVRVPGFEGTTFYRTGDHVYWQADGRLAFVGRSDDQVKIRGFRIELGEVEAELEKIPGVRRACAILLNQPPRGKVLAAAVVVAEDRKGDADGIRRQMAAGLPDFMVPSFIRVLRELPLNPNGKIDRKRLGELLLDTPSVEIEPAWPDGRADETQEMIVGQLREVLALAKIDETKSFFELGGDSLAAARFLTRISSALERAVPFSVLFGAETIGESIARIQIATGFHSGLREEQPVPIDRNGIHPLNLKQKRYLETSRRNPGLPVNVIGRAFRVSGGLRKAAFRQAVDWAVQRHEPLRTVLQTRADGEVGQRLLPSLPAPIESSTATATQIASDEWILDRLDRQVAAGLDAFNGPLIRFQVISSGRAVSALLVTSLHLATDGVSLAILLDDLFEAYGCYLEGRQPPLPPLQLQFLDFQVWHARRLDPATFERLRSFWQAWTGNLPIPHFRISGEDRVGDHCHGRMRYLSFGSRLAGRIRTWSHRHGVTPFVTCLAAYKILLTRYTGIRDLVVGTSVDLKDHPAFEGAIGDYSNLIPIRTRFGPEETVAAMAGRVVESFAVSMNHRLFPTTEIRDMVPRADSIFDDAYCPFSFTDMPPFVPAAPQGLVLQALHRKERDFFFVLQVNVAETPETFDFRITYATRVFSESLVDALLADFTRVLEALTADAVVRLSDIRWSQREGGPLVEVEEPASGRSETVVPAVLGEILSIRNVDTSRSFIGLGGDSILALRVAARLASELEVDVPPSLFLTGKPIEAVIADLARADRKGSGMMRIELETVDRNRLWPLAPKQSAYVDELRAHPGEPISVLGRAFRIEGRLQPDSLERALAFLVERHEPLRTVFLSSPDGSLAQKILPDLPASLEWRSVKPENLGEEEILGELSTFVQEGLDAFTGPILSLRILTDGVETHALVLKVLHIAVDGAWLPDLFGDLADAYNAVVAGRRPELPAVVRQYIDFQAWHRRVLEADAANAHERFWRTYLDGVPVLRFPGFPASDSGSRTCQGRILYFTLPEALTKAVRRRATERGVTPFTLNLACFVGLLRLYSGQTDFAVGTSVNLKEDERLDEAIGDFSNPIHIRFRLEGRVTLRGLLDRVSDALGKVMDHRFFPSAAIRRLVREGRSMLDDPINGFSFREMRDICERFHLSEARVSQVEGRSRLLVLLMSANFLDSGREMRLRVTYAPNVFEEEMVRGFFADYLKLAGLIAENSGSLLESFRPSWPEAAVNRSRVLSESAAHGPETTGGGTADQVSTLIASVLDRRSVPADIPFVDLGGDSVSALRLLRRIRQEFGVEIDYLAFTREPTANGIARMIGDTGNGGRQERYPPLEMVDPRGPVFLPADRAELIEKTLKLRGERGSGIARAYRVRGPFDEKAWARALRFVVGRHESLRMRMERLKDGRVSQVYPRKVSVKLELVDLRAIPLSTVDQDVERIYREESLTPLPFPFGPGFRFRAVRLPGEETLLLLNFSHGVVDGIGLMRVFDEIGEAYRAYSSGLEPQLPEVRLHALDYLKWQESWQAENRGRLTSYWRQVFAGGVPLQKLPFDEPGDPDGFYLGRYLYLELPPEMMAAIREFSAKLGTTEYFFLLSAFLITVNRVTGMDRPVVSFVSDARIHPDAEDMVGNIVNAIPLSGRLRDDDRLVNVVCDTAKSASGALNHAGMPVATLLDANGAEAGSLSAISFNQVPNTYEGLNLGSPDIQPVRRSWIWRKNTIVILIFENRDGSSTAQFSYPTELMQEAKARALLECYRRVIETIVETPEATLADLGTYRETGASGRFESALRSLFAEVLGHPVQRNESFFDQGGDSLTALRLIQRIRSLSKVPVAYSDLFEYASPCDLAALLGKREQELSASTMREAAPLTRLSRNRSWPATDNQLGYWRLINGSAGSITGNIVRPMRVRGPFRVNAFRKALRAVVEKHEALRTGLVAGKSGQVVQRIARRFTVPVSFESKPGLGRRQRDAFCRKQADLEGRKPFDLAKPPLFRATMVRFEQEDHFLMITVNHAVADGTSLGIIWDDLAAAYRSAVEGSAIRLEPLPYQYLDASAWQQRFLRDEVMTELERFWKESLAGIDGQIRFPLDGPMGKKRARPGFLHHHRFDPGLTESLRVLGRRHDLSLYCVVLAGFKLTLRAFSGMDDIAVSSAVDCREHPESLRVVGHFANRVIIRSRIDASRPIIDFLTQVRQNLGQALDHRQFPSSRALSLVPKDENGRCHPDDFVFNQGPRAGRELELVGAEVSPVLRRKARPNSVLGITWRDFGDEGMEVQVFQVAALFKPASLARFLAVWTGILESIADNPLLTIDQLPPAPEMPGPVAGVPDQERAGRLINLCKEVLGLKQLDLERSFFDLGGDSILALRLLSLIRRDLGFELDLRGLSRGSSLNEIVARVSTAQVVSGRDTAGPIPAQPDRALTALEGEAAESWRRNHLGKESFPFSITRTFCLDGVFDPDAFKQALEIVVGRHEVLRIRHRCRKDGRVERVVADGLGLDLRSDDWSGHSLEEGLLKAREAMDRESVEPLDLTGGHPCRFRLIRLAESVHVVILTFYHGLIDGTGLGIVFEELAVAYAALTEGREPALPPVPTRATDFDRWLESWTQAHAQRLETWWETLFRDGIPIARLPLENPERPAESLPALMHQIDIPVELMQQVDERSRGIGFSSYRYLLAAAFITFARHPEADVRLISTICNSRRHPDAEGVVGQFVDAVPVLIPDLCGHKVDTAVRMIGGRAGEAFAHAWSRAFAVGSRRLKAEGRADSPFNKIFFTQVPDLESAFHLAGLKVEPWSRRRLTMQGTLGFSAGTRPDGSVRLSLSAPTAQLSEQGVLQLLECYRETLAWMVKHPEAVIRKSVTVTRPAVGTKDGPLMPGNSLDRLTRIYEETLGRTVGSDTAFLAAGGDSLMAAGLLHRVSREFGMNLSFAAFKQDLSARQLAQVVDAAVGSAPVPKVSRTLAGGGQDGFVHPPLVVLPRPIPRSLMPEAVPGALRPDHGARWLVCRGFEVAGRVDPGIFEEAFRRVVQRHDALRRCFRRDRQGRVWCLVRDDPKLDLQVVELTGLSKEQADRRIVEFYAAESRRFLKPFSGVMHRVRMIRVGPDRTVILFTFSHRFVDGVSLVRIFSELGGTYQALLAGREPDLAPLRLQEPDYQDWLDRWEEANERKLETFWRGVLGSNLPERAFPLPSEAQRRRGIHGRFLNFTIPAEVMDRVRAFASDRATTPHYVVLAAAFAFLNRWLGLEDILASTVADMRILPEAKDVVGNFISNTPLRLGLSDRDTLGGLVDRVSRVGREAMDHRAPRLGLILKKLLDEAGRTDYPLGCFFLNQVTDTYGALQMGDLPVRPLLREVTGGSAFNFSHRFQRDRSLGLQVQFPIHLISAEAFEPLLADYRRLLRTIVDLPESRIGDLQKVGQDTKYRITGV